MRENNDVVGAGIIYRHCKQEEVRFWVIQESGEGSVISNGKTDTYQHGMEVSGRDFCDQGRPESVRLGN